MAAPSLSIAPARHALAEYEPHLMPFHLAHTGPAPVNVFFRPRAAVVVAPGAPSVAIDPTENSATAESAVTGAAGPSVPAQPQPGQPLRQTARFRGRAMHSLSVALPKGYTGLMLAGGSAPPVAKPELKPARGRRRAEAIDVDGEEDVDKNADTEGARVLRPAGRFDRFNVWNPDIPVDEGQDVYIRALKEWVALAAEIHRVEED